MSSDCGAVPTASLPLAVFLSLSVPGKVLSLVLKRSSAVVPCSLYLQVNEWTAEAKMRSAKDKISVASSLDVFGLGWAVYSTRSR